MVKTIVGFIGVLASIAVIVGTLIALNIIHPFPSPSTPNPPTLIVAPSSIKAESDCSVAPGFKHPAGLKEYDCQVALSESGQGSLTWSASGGGGQETQFTPQQGTLEPGQSVTVVIAITVSNGAITPATCPTTVNLVFANSTNQVNTVVVSWSC